MQSNYESIVPTIREFSGSSVSIERYSKILTMVIAGEPLSAVLNALVLLIEKEKLGTRASVLLLSEDKQRLLTGAAPNLPDDYNNAIHGIEIGHGVGSCGTAAFSGECVIVEDIEHHPFWQPYKALPLAAGLKACWSEPIKDNAGNVLGTFAMYYDTVKSPTRHDLKLIQEAAKLASLAIERSRAMQFQQLAANIFGHLPVALVTTDNNWSVLEANPAVYRTLSVEHLPSFNPFQLFAPAGELVIRAMLNELERQQVWQGELTAIDGLANKIELEVKVTSFSEGIGGETRFAWLFNDITERKQASELIRYQADHDALTGLSNRSNLIDKVQQHIEQTNGQQPFGFMLMDLDNFKVVNDTFGHECGDKLLVAVAERLQQQIGDEVQLARFGGDEFALFIPYVSDADALESLAEKWRNALSHSYTLANGQKLYATISIGIARYISDAPNLESLLNCADQAMYIAKSQGRNRYQLFTLRMQQEAERHAKLLSALKLAVINQDFELYFQPIVCINTNKIIRAEALLRWQLDGEYISPAEFIPIAESNGLIVQIGQWVRLHAMETLIELKKLGIDIGLSLNISTFEMWSDNLQDKLIASFNAFGKQLSQGDYPYQGLTLEITESVLMEQHSHLIETLDVLREKGIKISIDDFGTGYSSLSYLSHFPVDQIKIDKSFVQGADAAKKQQALIKAISSLSQALEVQVVAEGVETQSELEFIKSCGVAAVQGYYFYKPMNKSSLFELLCKTSKN
ncbi:EAL domain-containing protein [Shewanella waksmanii]|uniref:bifunctional diguanylate cyclase/phosphodiesterase n=1 Tax=Shewanella waksmanii TaxID=213783 RepID=UPI003735B6C9